MIRREAASSSYSSHRPEAPSTAGSEGREARWALEETVRATAVIVGATARVMVVQGGVRKARGTSGVTICVGVLVVVVDATAIAVSSVSIQLCYSTKKTLTLASIKLLNFEFGIPKEDEEDRLLQCERKE